MQWLRCAFLFSSDCIVCERDLKIILYSGSRQWQSTTWPLYVCTTLPKLINLVLWIKQWFYGSPLVNVRQPSQCHSFFGVFHQLFDELPLQRFVLDYWRNSNNWSISLCIEVLVFNFIGFWWAFLYRGWCLTFQKICSMICVFFWRVSEKTFSVQICCHSGVISVWWSLR